MSGALIDPRLRRIAVGEWWDPVAKLPLPKIEHKEMRFLSSDELWQLERSLQQARATDDGDAPCDGPNVVRIGPRT